MNPPKTPPKPDLSHVTFYSFTGDPRPATICKREEVTNHEAQQGPADEGFSVLMGTLRRSLIGQAAQTMASGQKFTARKNGTERAPETKSA
jgi:hypothetical protein